jgi:HEAT repeat protein
MPAPAPPPEPDCSQETTPVDKRSRKVYVLWGIALTFLGTVGLVCWLVVVPFLQTRAAMERAAVVRKRCVFGAGDLRTTLKELGGPERAAGKLTLYLRAPASLAPERALAVEALGMLRRPESRGLLTEFLRHHEAETRKRAAEALGHLGPDAADSVDELVRLLADKGERVRGKAADALGQIGPGAASAVPALAGMLDESSDLSRNAAISALGGIGPPAREIVPALVKLLDNPRSDAYAAAALGRIGPASRPALPRLRQMLAAKSSFAAVAAAESCILIAGKDEDALAVLMRVAATKEIDPARQAAILSLARLGEEAGPAVPMLIALLKRKDTLSLMFRTDVALALAMIGAPAEPAIPALEESLAKTLDPHEREHMAKSLETLRTKCKGKRKEQSR